MRPKKQTNSIWDNGTGLTVCRGQSSSPEAGLGTGRGRGANQGSHFGGPQPVTCKPVLARLPSSPHPRDLLASSSVLPGSWVGYLACLLTSISLIFIIWKYISQRYQTFPLPKELQKRGYRPWHATGSSSAPKTIKFNSRDDLMFSPQSAWRNLLKFPLWRVTSRDLILFHTSLGKGTKNSKSLFFFFIAFSRTTVGAGRHQSPSETSNKWDSTWWRISKTDMRLGVFRMSADVQCFSYSIHATSSSFLPTEPDNGHLYSGDWHYL